MISSWNSRIRAGLLALLIMGGIAAVATRIDARELGSLLHDEAKVEHSLSPDGRWALYVKDGLLYRRPAGGASIGSGEGDAPLFLTRGVVTDAVWSPDGSRIAYVLVAPKARSLSGYEALAAPSFVGVYEVATGRRWYLHPTLARDAAPVWVADGRRIEFERTVSVSTTSARADFLTANVRID